MGMSRMWRGRAAWVLLVTLLLGLMPQGPVRAQEEYDPQHTMLALNMAIVSLHRIVTTQDRIVLDQEYQNIIYNLKLGNIEPDLVLVSLYEELLDGISTKTLRQKESERFQRRYEQREKNRFVHSLTDIRAYGGGIPSFLSSLSVSCISAYFGYEDEKDKLQEGLEEELWKLEKENVDSYNGLQKRLLNSSWNLLRQYRLPDEYLLVQKNLDYFYKAVREPDTDKRLRMLKALEREFRVYPPYWFYRGRTALEAGDTVAGRQCFEQFDAVWRPVLRQDPYKLEVAKHRVRDLLDNSGVTEEVLKQLEIIKEHTPKENWADNLFMGVVYFELGEKKQGMACIEPNVDFGFEEDFSDLTLSLMRQGKDLSLLTERLKDLPAQLDDVAYNDKDLREAAEWARKLAEQGNPEAQNKLAEQYRDGKGVLQDYRKAAKWFSKAAEQGLAKAQNNLAQLYRGGKGVPQDDKKAETWFTKAAGQGYNGGQYGLGQIYENKNDMRRAYKWYYLAHLNGHSDAQSKLDEIEGKGDSKPKLPAEQIERARAEARKMYEEQKKRSAQ